MPPPPLPKERSGSAPDYVVYLSIFIQSTQLGILKMQSILEKIIRCSGSILSSSNMGVDPMVSETHPYMRGKKYTPGSSNNHPVLSALIPTDRTYLSWCYFFFF